MILSRKGDMFTLKSVGHNYAFNSKSGVFARWGHTPKDDPSWGYPELADIEISTICANGCPFCVPEGGMVATVGGAKRIETLVKGDLVFSHREGKTVINDIQEVYSRDYKGELIVIELENGEELKLTPEHEVLVKDKGWVLAKDLTEADVLVTTF